MKNINYWEYLRDFLNRKVRKDAQSFKDSGLISLSPGLALRELPQPR